MLCSVADKQGDRKKKGNAVSCFSVRCLVTLFRVLSKVWDWVGGETGIRSYLA